MTTYRWVAANGAWAIAGKWDQNAVPDGPDADAVLGGVGKYNVTIDPSPSIVVDSLTIADPNASLSEDGVLRLAGAAHMLALKAGTLSLGGTLAGGIVDVTGGTFELDNDATLSGTALLGAIDLSTPNSKATIINGFGATAHLFPQLGTISVSGAGDVLQLSNETVGHVALDLGCPDTSEGVTLLADGTVTLGARVVMSVTTGDLAYLAGDTLINQGTIEIGAGSALRFGVIGSSGLLGPSPSFSNTGTIIIGDGGFLWLGGSIGLAQLGSIDAAAGAELDIFGRLDLQDRTFDATSLTLGDGTVANGTIDADALTLRGETLDGITFGGTLDCELAYVTNGLTMQTVNGGPSAIDLTARAGWLDFLGDETLSNTTVSFSANYNINYSFLEQISVGIADTLALGSTATVIATSDATGIITAGVLINHGQFDDAGGDLFFAISEFFRNDGTIAITSGGLFQVGNDCGPGPAVFTNNGLIDIAAGGTLSADRQWVTFINSGVIEAQAGPTSISAIVTGNGILQIDAGAVLDLADGGPLPARIEGAGTLELERIGWLESSFAVAHRQVVAVANLVIVNGSDLSGAGTVLSAVTDDGDIVAVGGTLRLAGVVSGGGQLQAQSGAVLALSHGGTLAGGFGGPGTIELQGADPYALASGVSLGYGEVVVQAKSVTLGATVAVTNSARDTWDMAGPNGATETLSGGSGSAFTNAGLFEATGGGSATVSVAFINQANVQIASGALSFTDPLANDGTMTAATATMRFLGQIAGTGKLDIGSAATAALLGGATAGTTADFLSSNGLLELMTPLNFAGTIEGFVPGDKIDLPKTGANGLSFIGGVLSVLDGGSAVATLHFAGSYAKTDFTLASDSNGGTYIIHT
jgi:hypothetical protein